MWFSVITLDEPAWTPERKEPKASEPVEDALTAHYEALTELEDAIAQHKQAMAKMMSKCS